MKYKVYLKHYMFNIVSNNSEFNRIIASIVAILEIIPSNKETIIRKV